MKRLVLLVLGCNFIISLMAQHQNILISDQNNPNEPSIFINKKNTNEIVGGSNLSNVYKSIDGGLTWSNSTMSSSYGVWGDPVISADTAGNFYFLHLSNPQQGNWIDRIVCQKMAAGTNTWNDGSFTGLNDKKMQDKHWIAIDPKTNYMHVSWTEFDKYASTNPADSTRILYSRSEDSGETWSNPIKINEVSGDCIDSDNTVEGAVPAIGPNGEIYDVWVGPVGLVFNKSLDGGHTWMKKNIFISDVPGGWDYAIPGIYRCNGLPFTDCDHSGGQYNGNIYVNWTDQRNGETDTDIWLSRSSDGGTTWSTPIRVNNDGPGKQQFFSSMTVDQVTGYIWVVFYDRREYTDARTDVYMAVSKNGGESFDNFKLSETPFLPDEGIFFGDYTGVSAHNNIVRPIWTRLDQNKLSIWTAIVDINTTSTISQIIPKDDTSIAPNPAKNKAFYSFSVHNQDIVKISLKDFNGNFIAVLKKGMYPPGKYIEEIDTNKLNLPAGVYIVEKLIGDQIKSSKLIIGK